MSAGVSIRLFLIGVIVGLEAVERAQALQAAHRM